MYIVYTLFYFGILKILYTHTYRSKNAIVVLDSQRLEFKRCPRDRGQNRTVPILTRGLCDVEILAEGAASSSITNETER